MSLASVLSCDAHVASSAQRSSVTVLGIILLSTHIYKYTVYIYRYVQFEVVYKPKTTSKLTYTLNRQKSTVIKSLAIILRPLWLL